MCGQEQSAFAQLVFAHSNNGADDRRVVHGPGFARRYMSAHPAFAAYPIHGCVPRLLTCMAVFALLVITLFALRGTTAATGLGHARVGIGVLEPGVNTMVVVWFWNNMHACQIQINVDDDRSARRHDATT